MTSQRHISGNERLAIELSLISSCFNSAASKTSSEQNPETMAAEAVQRGRLLHGKTQGWFQSCFGLIKHRNDSAA